MFDFRILDNIRNSKIKHWNKFTNKQITYEKESEYIFIYYRYIMLGM